MARQSAQVKKTSKATETSSQRKGPISSDAQNVTTSLPRRIHLNAEFEMEPTKMYFRCIVEQHCLMELPSISSVTNLQDRQQVVKQTITAGKGSLTTSTVKFIQGLPNNHPLHWVYHVPKGLGSGKYSICPCSPVVSPWRDQNNIVLEEHVLCNSRSKFFTLDGMVKHLYNKSADDPFHKAAYDYLSSFYKGWKHPEAPPTNVEACSTQPKSQSDVPPASNQSASTNGIPPSLDEAFHDYSNVQ